MEKGRGAGCGRNYGRKVRMRDFRFERSGLGSRRFRDGSGRVSRLISSPLPRLGTQSIQYLPISLDSPLFLSRVASPLSSILITLSNLQPASNLDPQHDYTRASFIIHSRCPQCPYQLRLLSPHHILPRSIHLCHFPHRGPEDFEASE